MTTLFDGSHVLAYAIAALLIGLFVSIFRNRLFIYREREVNAQNLSKNTQLALVLKTGKVRVWTYDTRTHHFMSLDSDGATDGDYLPIDFAQFFDPDDFEVMRQHIAEIYDGKEQAATTIVKSRLSSDDDKKEQKYMEISIEILEHDSHGKPTLLLGMQRDITNDLKKKEQVKQLLMQYHTVFNQSLIDIVYYDKDGVMTDINAKACETFGIADRQQFLDTHQHISNHPGYEAIKQDYEESTYLTALIDPRTQPIAHADTDKDKTYYYELIFNKIHDQKGNLTGIFSAGRNVTEMVESRRHQQMAIRELSNATKRIQAYVNNINYALKVSEVRLMNYYPQTHMLEISNDLTQAQYQLTQLRCIDMIHPDSLHHAKRILRQMDSLSNTKISQTLRTNLRDAKHRNLWMAFNIVPVQGADGKIDHYFGMCRNETEMVETENLLKQETLKAQETDLLKSSFLLNMSYEIRTPLNAVLGFAELFNQDHDPNDEPIFVKEIKDNSNKLLALVNDVLYLSRLDARMVEFTNKPTDFATLFDGTCQMGWSKDLRPDVKPVIENPYESLVLEIDEENLSQVIQRLCANAAFHAKTGLVRAKYQYRRGMLDITIEDTGDGIDKEALKHVFDRFSTADDNIERYGTGLGMPIVKELVEQMNGVIEITSEKGKGTTVWVSIPCKMTEMVQKVITV